MRERQIADAFMKKRITKCINAVGNNNVEACVAKTTMYVIRIDHFFATQNHKSHSMMQ